MQVDEKDKEILIRVPLVLEQVLNELKEVKGQVETLTKQTNGHMLTTESRLAVAEDKLSRLEKLFYGAIVAIIGELISIVVQWTQQHH